MSPRTQVVRGRGLSWRAISILLVGIGLAVLVGANAHLVYVALKSQPDCVPHVKQTGDSRAYTAAGSAC